MSEQLWSKENLIAQLNKTVQAIENGFNPSKKTVAFLSHVLQYRGQYGMLPSHFYSSCNVISVVENLCGDDFEKGPNPFHFPTSVKVDTGELINLGINIQNIDVIFKADIKGHAEIDQNFLSQKAKRVYLPHDIIGPALAGKDLMSFDYVIVPSTMALEETIRINQGPSQFNKKIGLIPGGYPRLDQTLATFEKKKSESLTKQDSILFAPTLRMFDATPNVINYALAYEIETISMLLKNFDEKIIYRPHPFNFKNNHLNIAPVLDKFKNDSRFVLDNQTLPIESYLRSKFLITDISCTAYTYAFTTLNPVFFHMPYVNRDRSFVKYADKIGTITKTDSELINHIKNILKSPSEYNASVKNYRDKEIYNIGQSHDYLLNHLDYIINDEKHPEWTYITI